GTYHRGLEDGRKEGLEQGAEAGRRAVLRDMIIALLEVRGLPMTETMRTRVREESSLPILQGWARKAREISQAEALSQ
ncbi:MAG: hypothetical protein KC431_32005, partial [Myxococcales bacterium]|nr:hypothetical protein [Myxococcales bacterium]